MRRRLHHLELLAREHQNHPRQLSQIHALLLATGLLSAPHSLRSATALYNILIKGCLRSLPATAVLQHSLHIFSLMLATSTPPSPRTFPSLVQAAHQSPFSALALHSHVLRRGFLLDRYVHCCFLSLYSKLGLPTDAVQLFDEMPHPDLAARNAMLHALCRNGDVNSALRLFLRMEDRDVISWATIVGGFLRARRHGEALRWFRILATEESLRLTEATLVIGISACAGSDVMGAGGRGREIHGYVVKHGFPLTAVLGTALVDMYGKSGRLAWATTVFGLVKTKAVCIWNAMISGSARNGQEVLALELFDEMVALGFNPTATTFVVVLSACARAGMVDRGLGLFASMRAEFGVEPAMEHYGCVVDLYGRAGMVRKAAEFVERMPVEPDASMLGALLGACRVHGEVELAREVGARLLELQPWHSGRYMVLSGTFAAAAMWDSASEVKQAMDMGRVRKVAAYSLVDSGGSTGLHGCVELTGSSRHNNI